MNKLLVFFTLLIILFILRAESFPSYGGPNSPSFRREDRHSFRAPFLQSGTGILYWDIEGSAFVNDDFIRLTPDQKSVYGSIWNNEPMENPWWEVILEFRVHGSGRLGADGLALWYIDRKEGNNQDVSIYGSKNLWKGLGIIFDTFDNDGNGDHPLISVFYNDGTKFYETAKDGQNMKLGSCTARYRNDRFNAKARVKYYQGLLSVQIDPAGSDQFEKCVEDIRLDIPVRYTFGVSAATGGLTDNHDVYSFTTYSLDSGNFNKNTMNYNNAQFEREQQEKQERERQEQERQRQLEQQQQQQQQGNQQGNQQGQQQQQQQQQQDYQQQQQEEFIKTLNEYTKHQTQNQNTQPPQQHQEYNNIQEEIKNLPEKEQIGFLVKKIDSLNEAILQLHVVLDDPEYKKSFDGLRDQVNDISQAMISLLKTSAQQKDIETLKISQSQFIKDFYDFRANMQDLKASLTNRFNNQDNEVSKNIERLNLNVNSFKGMVESNSRDIQKISSILSNNVDQIASTIQKNSGTFGFWTYFLFVQAIFIFGFVFWRKYKDDNNKKLI